MYAIPSELIENLAAAPLGWILYVTKSDTVALLSSNTKLFASAPSNSAFHGSYDEYKDIITLGGDVNGIKFAGTYHAPCLSGSSPTF